MKLMRKQTVPAKTWLLEQLERIEYQRKDSHEEIQAEQMNLAGSLLLLTGINHEHEYEVCTQLASHLLEKLPTPRLSDEFDEE